MKIKPKQGKKKIYAYLDTLSRKEIAFIRQSGLHSKFSHLKLETVAVYLSEYRKERVIKPIDSYLKDKSPKSAHSIVYRFLDENFNKRYAVELSKEFPDISVKLIQQYMAKWFMENKINPPKGYWKYIDVEKWTEEKLEVLKVKNFASYMRIIKNIGKAPREQSITMDIVNELKNRIEKDEGKIIDSVFSRKKISCERELNLLTRVGLKYPSIDTVKASDQISLIEKKLHSLVRTHAPSVVVGTAIFNSNEISKSKVKRIMSNYGGCSEQSIRNLIKRLNID